MKRLLKQSLIPLAVIALMLAISHFVAPVSHAAAPANSILRQLDNEIATVAEKAKAGVVSIQSTMTTRQRYVDPSDLFNGFFGPGGPNGGSRGGSPFRERSHKQTGLGNGVLIDKDGTILTNNHVIAGSDDLEVILADGRKFKGKVLGTDPETEVAVIKIEGKDLPAPLELGDSDTLKVGNLVLAIGSPQGLTQTVTFGIVSALNRSSIGITDFANFIQTDASINPGNSGGPLLNVEGQVIGINTAIYSSSGGSEGIGFAIPINDARSIAEKLQKGGKVTRGYLGIVMGELTAEMGDNLGTKDMKGAVVTQVVPGGPSDNVLKVYDAIVELGGKALKNDMDLRNRVAAMAPGDKADLTVVREGKKTPLSVKLGTRPKDGEEAATAAPDSEDKPANQEIDLGFTVRELSQSDRAQMSNSKIQGVLVTNVKEESAAYDQGLRPGMVIQQVNRQPVTTPDDVQKALKSGGRRNVMLLVRTQNGDAILFIPKK
jgi:serine protease Do